MSTVTRVTNREIASFARMQIAFKANSAHGTHEFEGFGIAYHLTPEQKAEIESSNYIVYSYRTPIAWKLADGSLFVDDRKYSNTTSRTQNILRSL